VLQEQPQKLLLRLALILVPALAGALAWSYTHRDSFGGPHTVRSPAIASPPAQAAFDPRRVEADPGTTAGSAVLPPVVPDPPQIERDPGTSAGFGETAPAGATPAAGPALAVAVLPAAPPVATAVLPAAPASAAARQAGDDPAAIRVLAERRLAASGAAANDQQRAAGVRLLQIAALLGDGPARARIARDYPRAAVYSLVPPKDAIRYALDDYAAGTASAGNRNHSFVALAAFFAGRGRLETFAATLVEAIAEDPRLQSPESLEVLLGSLAHVRGSCRAVARVLAVTRLPALECPRSLQASLLAHVRKAGRAGREDDSRRRGLQMLRHLGTR